MGHSVKLEDKKRNFCKMITTWYDNEEKTEDADNYRI